jgi:16S rRNA (adenine1518-N6/adenine1519-N6)-dimethyltransferase
MRARKRFGQHFLEAAWADKLVAAMDPRPGDRFVEIGPGAGALTLRLAPRVARITGVEVDRDLAAALREQLPANVELIEADFLDFDLGPLAAEGPLRVAGNLPYNISSPILLKLVSASRRHGGLIDGTVMLQREVAERLEAEPGTAEYGALTIAVRLHADVRRVLTLPPGAFRPPPRVHSAVVRLTFRPPPVAPREEPVLDQLVRAIFSRRRKTLTNALAPFAHTRGVAVAAALEEAEIDGRRRGETLQLSELVRLADAFTTREQ